MTNNFHGNKGKGHGEVDEAANAVDVVDATVDHSVDHSVDPAIDPTLAIEPVEPVAPDPVKDLADRRHDRLLAIVNDPQNYGHRLDMIAKLHDLGLLTDDDIIEMLDIPVEEIEDKEPVIA